MDPKSRGQGEGGGLSFLAPGRSTPAATYPHFFPRARSCVRVPLISVLPWGSGLDRCHSVCCKQDGTRKRKPDVQFSQRGLWPPLTYTAGPGRGLRCNPALTTFPPTRTALAGAPQTCVSGVAETTPRGEDARKGSSPGPLEGAQLCQYLDFGL